MSARPIKTVFLYTGYVETQSHACLILTHRVGFKTKEKLVDHLHEVFKMVLIEDRDRHSRNRTARVSDLVYGYIRGDNQDAAL